MSNNRKLTVILIPILLIPIAGLVFAHYTDTIDKRYKIHVACGEIDCESYKAYSPDDIEAGFDERYDNTLFVSAIVYEGWYAWIGLVIKNNGIYDMMIDDPSLTIEAFPEGYVTCYSKAFYYGPGSQAFFNHHPNVWGAVTGAAWPEKLDPIEGVIGVKSAIPPVYLEPDGDHNDNKLIIWIYLSIVSAPEDFDLLLAFNIQATIANPFVEISRPVWP